jgi:ArsR family transcriptional regulator, arsenate/arsenite/antimonite-responsive transcriptional repressor
MVTRSKSATIVNRLFRAFSDQTRLRALHLLRGGELCVCDLVAILGVPQPTASRHLAYLRQAGLVRTRKQGLWTYYRLAPAVSSLHKKLLTCLDCCVEEIPQLAEDAVGAAKLRNEGASCCPPYPQGDTNHAE